MTIRTVIVTGAAGVLGSATASLLTGQGHVVIAMDLADRITLPRSPALTLAAVDLTDLASATAAFDAVAQQFGSIDGLANVAGGFAWETIANGNLATWERLFALNVKTALNGCRCALPLLRNEASIVNVGAVGAAKAALGMAAYASSKAGVARLTEALAQELRARRIRVNAVLPSIIDTPANRTEMPDADFAAWVGPDELAEVIAFLLSPEARAINGALIPVCGGL
jgi:NAD(P)-dependent dehydrogenase (short-subunit alcohol dehydrogenase family)